MTPHLINAAIGMWLMFAPAELGLNQDASTRAYILGPVIAAFGIISCSQVTRGVRRVLLLAGLWLMISPWVWGEWKTEIPAAINEIVCGAALAILSLFRGKITQHFGGGWKALWTRPGAPNL